MKFSLLVIYNRSINSLLLYILLILISKLLPKFLHYTYLPNEHLTQETAFTSAFQKLHIAGFYDSVYSRGYTQNEQGQKVFYKSVIASGIGGVIGHYLANPLHLVKTHLQAESAKAIEVGFQHQHKGTLKGLKKIYGKSGVSSKQVRNLECSLFFGNEK